MAADAIHEAHRASNRLPRRHAGQTLEDPWSGEPATIDAPLVPLMVALWSVGVRTVASCENVAEFAAVTCGERRPLMARSRAEPLHHVDTIGQGLAYIRLVHDEHHAPLLDRLAACATGWQAHGPLVQVEFTIDAVPYMVSELAPSAGPSGDATVGP